MGARPGQDHHRAVLTFQDVWTIRTGTAPDLEYADRFGVSELAVAKARRGESWRRHPAPVRLITGSRESTGERILRMGDEAYGEG